MFRVLIPIDICGLQIANCYGCRTGQQKIEKAFLNAIHTDKPYDIELQFNAADGTPKCLRTMGSWSFR